MQPQFPLCVNHVVWLRENRHIECFVFCVTRSGCSMKSLPSVNAGSYPSWLPVELILGYAS